MRIGRIGCGYTHRLSRWFQQKDNPQAPKPPSLDPPFADVRMQAKAKLEAVVVSHRVRRKVSGPLHKDTTYGDAGPVEDGGRIPYRWFVTRKPVETLTKALLNDTQAWPDVVIRERLNAWIDEHSGDPKKAFVKGYPTVSEGGPPIRKVRVRTKQQERLMAKLKNGYADLGNNHHAVVFRLADGTIESDIVSLFEAAERLRKREPVVRRQKAYAVFLMSLGAGDALHFPDGERKGLWIVQGVWASGQIVLAKANDAEGTSVFRPTAGSIIKAGGRKVAIDPIGRMRRALD